MSLSFYSHLIYNLFVYLFFVVENLGNHIDGFESYM